MKNVKILLSDRVADEDYSTQDFGLNKYLLIRFFHESRRTRIIFTVV